ncbi:MAG: hypothetical protein ACLFQB_07790 [Chitinispirillaceae bacterium]
MGIAAIIILAAALVAVIVIRKAKKSRASRWLVPCLKMPRDSKPRSGEPVHLYVAFCNRLSPYWAGVSQEIAEHRVVTWYREYIRFASHHADSQGKKPVHTFFYDESDYNPRFVDTLSRMCREGIADVDILLKHENDTPDGFRRKIEGFRDVLFHHHGLLRKDHHDRIIYGFIHGNGALNNCRPDGRFCGVNQESGILKETGCYADFTFPSAPDVTQPPIINQIYFASGSPEHPAGHEQGYPAGKEAWSEKDLMLVEGPTGLNWQNRRYGIVPRVENGEISFRRRFTPNRAKVWIDSAVHVQGAPEHLFIKLHTFGAVDSTVRYLFGESGIHSLYNTLENEYGKSGNYILHYVSAYEMYRTIRSLCQGSPVYHDHHHVG